MRKIGLFNIGKLGLVKSAGKAKTDINKVIEKLERMGYTVERY
jgi:biotin operon repressor